MRSDIKTTVYPTRSNFADAESQFLQWLRRKNLDQEIADDPSLVTDFENALDFALADAFNDFGESRESHLFLHRILYSINRLKLFWYDDLENYVNENSPYIFSIRNQIESAWQAWEGNKFDVESLERVDVSKALKQRVAVDLAPEASEEDLYMRNEMSESGYRRLLEISSVSGLVEASQLSRVLGGVGNEIQSMLTRIFLEEYGGGRLSRKHSSFFTAMLEALDMDARPEAYFDVVPWEVLANINLSFTLCEHKQNFLRYVGGLLYFETSAPVAFGNFKLAGERLGLSYDALGYWDIHIKEDERHGRWMLDDVALPLIEKYEDMAWQMVLGYDEQKVFNGRAGKAVTRSVQEAEKG
ncbi:MAG: iron-containing redox enzyme family protein [Nitrospinae bacterium]|nr:iron-containing redox enzyme family protein [Nitrospinota bacterium]